MTGTIVADFTRIAVDGWKMNQESPSNNILAFWTLVQEFQSQFFDAGINYVEILTEGGEFQGAFGYFSQDPARAANWERASLGPFEGQEVAGTSIPTLFDYFTQIGKEQYNVTVSFIRMLDAEVVNASLDFFDQIIRNEQKGIPTEKCLNFLANIGPWLSNGKIKQYPEPPIFAFLREVGVIYANLPVTIFLHLIERLRPEQTRSTLLHFPAGIVALNKGFAGKTPILTLNPEVVKPPADWETFPDFLQSQKKTHNVQNILYLDAEEIASFAKELASSNLPLSSERTNVLGQRALNLLRNYGEVWSAIPRPLIVGNWIRLFNRIIGVNFNLRNLSYWYIPHTLSNALRLTTGGTGSLLLFRATWTNNIPTNLLAYVASIEENSLQSITIVDPETLAKLQEEFGNKKQVKDSIAKIFLVAREQMKNLKAVIFLSEEFGKSFMATLQGCLNVNPLKLVSLSRRLNILKRSHCFYIYPEPAWYKYIARMGGFTLIRWISRLCFDPYEF
ncbi:MAG TPA: hypothetical protein VKK79_13945 [Candidatus Lokiarchaeia archaeon]|nr:hypothetical protein [Candidatus Lokiarchaeia archaeon]